MKIKLIIPIVLLLLLAGCSKTNPTTQSELPSSLTDNSEESTLFSSLCPNNWTHIATVFPLPSGFLGEYSSTSEKENIDSFYEIFSSAHLTKVDESYENRQAEFEIGTPDHTFSLLILTSDRISVNNVVYSVDIDFTEKIQSLVDLVH